MVAAGPRPQPSACPGAVGGGLRPDGGSHSGLGSRGTAAPCVPGRAPGGVALSSGQRPSRVRVPVAGARLLLMEEPRAETLLALRFPRARLAQAVRLAPCSASISLIAILIWGALRKENVWALRS